MNQQDTKTQELMQKIEHQEALITDLKYRAQEAKRSLLAGKKEELDQIEAGKIKIEELTKVYIYKNFQQEIKKKGYIYV